MSENSQFEEELRKLEERVISYDQNVNNSGIWLFLATLGCWSVEDPNFRTLAVVFTFLIFSHQLISRLDSFKPFEMDVKKIENKINSSNLTADKKKARKFDLLDFKKRKLSLMSRMVMRVPAYYLATVFLLASAVKWFKISPSWL
jgi:hypothetical protein